MRREVVQALSQPSPDEDVLAAREEQQEDGRRALQDKPAVLAQPVDDKVKVARSARLSFAARAVDEILELAQAEDVLARLDVDGHLLAVVGPGLLRPCACDPTTARRMVPFVGDRARSSVVGLLTPDETHPRTSVCVSTYSAAHQTGSVSSDAGSSWQRSLAAREGCDHGATWSSTGPGTSSAAAASPHARRGGLPAARSRLWGDAASGA